jgi:uncharacterized protein (DUF983 family)
MKHARNIRPGAPAPGPDGDDAPDAAERDLGRAMRRGWRGRCPACGGGPLFERYLKVRARCPSCSERLDVHTADDAPTWITILVVGHIIGPAMLTVWDLWNPPIWVHWTLWPTAALLLSLLLLPRFKGVIVGLQWAKRLAGFAEARPR